MGMDFIMYMPRPSLRPGKSAITREEWRRRTQSQHEVSALRERPHQVETLGVLAIVHTPVIPCTEAGRRRER